MESKKVVPPTKPHFFKPFLPSSGRQLTIPDAFFKRLEGQNCDKAVLRHANGKTWDVKIRGRKLEDGWEEFVKHYDLQVGDFLVFRHQGDMVFDVMVFDKSFCERNYPSVTPRQVNVKVENETLDLDGQVDQEVKNQTSNLKGTTDKSTGPIYVMKTKAALNIKEKAKPSLVKNPHFEITLTSTNIKRSSLTIPSKFVRQNSLRRASWPILVNQQGRSWTARMKHNTGRTYIGWGWSYFRFENNLNCGDSFIFDLIWKEGKLVFKMRGLRKAEKPNSNQEKPPFCDIKYASIQNPYFVALASGGGNVDRLVVPARFARMNGLFGKGCNMIVEDERGKSWPMSLTPYPDRLTIRNGWREFISSKDLKPGDLVILELIKNGEKLVIMKFHGVVKVEQENSADEQQNSRKVNN